MTNNKAPSTLCRRNLKTHQMSSVHTTPDEFKNTEPPDVSLRKTRAGKSNHRDVIAEKKIPFSKYGPSTKKKQGRRFQIPPV